MKMFKQFKYKLLPVLLIAVLMLPFFSFNIHAEEPVLTGVYCSDFLGETDTVVFNSSIQFVNMYNSVVTQYCYVTNGSCYDGFRGCFYLSPSSNTSSGYILGFINSPLFTFFQGSGGNEPSLQGTNYNGPNCSASIYKDMYRLNSCKTLYFETNMPIFATYDEAVAFSNGLLTVHSAINYMKVYDCETESWVPVAVEEPDEEPDHNFDFSIYDKFQDFYNQSHEFNDAAHKLTVTENSNNPNDGIFQSLLVNLSDLQHTGNSIMQQMSNQMQNFSENFFGNFAQYTLGLLTDIKDGIGGLVDNIIPDNLETIIDQIYQSGLDSEGNFSLSTSFNYWFVPEEDYFGTIFNQLSSSREGLFQVFDMMDYMKSGLLNIEPVPPVIIIPGGTYGFLTIPDIELGFSWFEAWKTYTDPLIAAFLYVAYAWHLILQIPGILSGSAGTVAAGNHFENNEVRRENNERLRGR